MNERVWEGQAAVTSSASTPRRRRCHLKRGSTGPVTQTILKNTSTKPKTLFKHSYVSVPLYTPSRTATHLRIIRALPPYTTQQSCLGKVSQPHAPPGASMSHLAHGMQEPRANDVVNSIRRYEVPYHPDSLTRSLITVLTPRP